MWGLARATGRRVVLRIEDHDRQRSRPEFDAALLEDLGWLGFVADTGPVRQSGDSSAYEAALARLREAGWSTPATAPARLSPRGPGRTGGRGREAAVRAVAATERLADRRGTGLRVALGSGVETWDDLRLGLRRDEADRDGDVLVRDRHGNWTYPFCVVVDDMRQGIDLVVRGEDLLDATARQIRLGRLLGRDRPPAFYHHPLIRKPGGAKLSKSDGDTGVRELRARGLAPAAVLGEAAAAVGLIADPRPLDLGGLDALFG